MARKKRKLAPEVRAFWDARHEETSKLLLKRIAYHQAKLEEERAARREPA